MPAARAIPARPPANARLLVWSMASTQYMSRDAKALSAGGTPYIETGEGVVFDDGRFKPGDEVASSLI